MLRSYLAASQAHHLPATGRELGLILTALIVGAAMIMRVDTPVRIFGYPALVMLMLMLAGGGAAYLALQIVRHDRAPKIR